MVPMIGLLLVALVAGLVGAAAYVVREKRRRTTPEELRGDWWPDFEAKLREYARSWEASDGLGRRSASRPSRPTPYRDRPNPSR